MNHFIIFLLYVLCYTADDSLDRLCFPWQIVVNLFVVVVAIFIVVEFIISVAIASTANLFGRFLSKWHRNPLFVIRKTFIGSPASAVSTFFGTVVPLPLLIFNSLSHSFFAKLLVAANTFPERR